MLHIRLQDAFCVICKYPVNVRDKVSAVLGNRTSTQPTGGTLSFECPKPGYVFIYVAVYTWRGREKEDWRVCRYPPCELCSKSPEARIFHTDCFRLMKLATPALKPQHIWEIDNQVPMCAETRLGALDIAVLGLYTKEWGRKAGRSLIDGPLPPGDMETADIILLLERLPPELCALVVCFCPEALLWRYGAAMLQRRPLSAGDITEVIDD